MMFRQRIVASGATGLYLSITCAEDVPFIKDDAARAKLDDTFLGDYRYRQMREACNEWPRGEVEKDYFKPVRANVPVLITTGKLDPVTPPLYGDRVARNMPNSLHVVVPSGGHGFSGLKGDDCIDGGSTVDAASVVERPSRRASRPARAPITTCCTTTPTRPRCWPDAPGLWNEAQVEGWKPIVDAVHQRGGRMVLQLWHMARAFD